VSRFTADLFDRVADGYDEEVPFFAELGERLVSWAAPLPGARVLDLGAGRGAITRALVAADGCGSITAGDISPRMVQLVSELDLPGVQTGVLDAQRLALPDAAFDMVFAGFVLSVVPDAGAAFAEVARVLRLGGELVVSVPGPSADGGWWERYGRIVAEFAARVPAGTAPGMETPPDPWDDVLERVGLQVVDTTRVELDLPLDGPEGHWRWLLSHGNRWLYDALDEADRAEFRRRVLRSLTDHHPAGGTRLIAGAEFVRMVRTRGRGAGVRPAPSDTPPPGP
jgi:SAM-dependent methyltransferase